MGTTSTPHIGGALRVLLIIGVGMLIQLASLICSLLSFATLVRREPDLYDGLFYAQLAVGSAAFAISATLLLLWWAGAVDLHTTVPLHAPSIAAASIALVLWKARSSRSERRVGRRRAGLCPRCGYDLPATRERCPECGMEPAPRPAA